MINKVRDRQSGFTLIELLIAIAIVAIIVSIAYPSYLTQVQQTRRANAQADLVELAAYMQRFYTENFTYAGAALPYNTSPKSGGQSFYNIALGNATATTYTLTATPQGPQVGDSCGNMTINQRGQGTPANCW
ncbi:MAG: prepilin-type N-terminal cleavage/methylation domain-containing protein [Methylophaga sp.]|nr:prepilin-type N-terminal cleavage/methylation domain-containing protein [Methylophaga sp.]